ncbi:MAG: hypothetical protein EOP72_06400 [Variovorax sp.]|nr:MAG: hypothetical protein EOP72_06400 [Variovorax sp.]
MDKVVGCGRNRCWAGLPVRCPPTRHTPRLRALRVASPTPSPGATPAARRSRFRGVLAWGCDGSAGLGVDVTLEN